MFKPSNKQVSVTLISILLLTYYQVKDIAEALYKIKQNKTKKKKQKKEQKCRQSVVRGRHSYTVQVHNIAEHHLS